MPIYEYYCAHCDVIYDKLQKINAEPLTVCSVCEQAGLRKQISAPGFKLTGSGWYETDFKTKSAAAKPTSSASSPTTATPAVTSATTTTTAADT